MKHAKVYVDLANKSCVIADNRAQHGAWAPGITRSNVATAIATDGWMFALDSEWSLTVDGGVRDVVLTADLAQEVVSDDVLLDRIGSALPGAAGMLLNDDLYALLLDWRNETDRPIAEVADEDVDMAMAAINLGRVA